MLVLKTRFEVRAGEPVEVPAAADALDFMLHAKSRSLTINGEPVPGLVASPNEANDRILLAASADAAPGEYPVTLSATSATGEVRETSMNVVVSHLVTVPKSATKPPVVLLNGWITGFNNSCPVASTSSTTFGNLAQYLVNDGVPVVYLFDNCAQGAGQTIETLAVTLGTYLNAIKYDDGTQVPQIDLVAHSMGGLIARAYLAGLQADGLTFKPPSPTLVRKLVLIATPNFGSFVAGNYSTALIAGTQSVEMVPGSAFLWNLATWNQRGDDLNGVDAIAVAGNAGSYAASIGATTLFNNYSDGLVTLTSASMSFVSQKPSLTRVVPYCHVDPSVFVNPGLGTFYCNAVGIANVTGTDHLTGKIVRSFLQSTTDWQSLGTAASADPVLSTNGGYFFAVQNTGGAYLTDLTAVTWGTVTLINGGNPNTIYYTDFVTGTGAYKASSTSVGTINCGTLAAEIGYFAAARCKIGAAIVSITPLVTTAVGKVVTAGTSITLNGAFSSSQCSNCKVTATPAGSTTPQTLKNTSWGQKAIVVQLPPSLTGYSTITVNDSVGNDSMGIMAVALVTTPTISIDNTSESFAYQIGGSLPGTQSFAVTNTGTGTLAWTATTTATWLSLSDTSGTAPSTVTVTANPGVMAAGTYTGTIAIAASGASNTPVTINVSLVITAAPASLVVAPLTLSFAGTSGGGATSSQPVAISSTDGGAFNWVASSDAYWLVLSATSGTTPGSLAVSVTPGNLPAGPYTAHVTVGAADKSGTPAVVAVTLNVTGTGPTPAITSLVNAASFQPTFASATWVSIFGANLSQLTYQWQGSDFAGQALPTSLAGVTVKINGIAAYISYISPTQLNVLAPDDATTGPVQVVVTVANQASNSFTAQKTVLAPAFLMFPAPDNSTPIYAAARHLDYSLLVKAGYYSGVTSVAATPGETILLYGVGFGPTTPLAPTDQLVTTSPPLANNVQITIGDAQATVTFAGLSSSGLYQFNVVVPSLPNGDARVVATLAGQSTQTGVFVTIQQ